MGIYESAEIYGLRISYYNDDDDEVAVFATTVFETVQKKPMTIDEVDKKIIEYKSIYIHRELKYYVLREVTSTLDLATNPNKTYYMWLPYSFIGK